MSVLPRRRGDFSTGLHCFHHCHCPLTATGDVVQTPISFLVTNEQMQGNGMKLHNRRLRLNIKKTFTQRVVRHWNSILKEVFMAPNPPDFKKCLDNTLRNMVCNSYGCTVHRQELDLNFVCPLQLRIFYELMIPGFSFEYSGFEPKP